MHDRSMSLGAKYIAHRDGIDALSSLFCVASTQTGASCIRCLRRAHMRGMSLASVRRPKILDDQLNVAQASHRACSLSTRQSRPEVMAMMLRQTFEDQGSAGVVHKILARPTAIHRRNVLVSEPLWRRRTMTVAVAIVKWWVVAVVEW